MTISSAGDRYLRQSQFAPIGDEGQTMIEQSTVAVLGCGALGSVAAELLARAGVGTLYLVDRDVVEWSNLQRQSLYTEADAQRGLSKAEAAANHLREINSSITLVEHVVDITVQTIATCLESADLVIDATDNFPVRMLLNDWSLSTQTPWVHGGCVGAAGQVRLFRGVSPCLRCLLPELPGPGEVETCDTAGVIGPATHLIASLQAAEALKWLSGNHEAIRDEVLAIDVWDNQTREINISPALSSQCPACSEQRYEFLNPSNPTGPSAEMLCGRDAAQIAGSNQTIDLMKITATWKNIGLVQQTRFFSRLKLQEDQSITLFRDGRAVISGVRDIAHARSLYDRYVGS